MIIADELQTLRIPINDLFRWDKNPRIGHIESVKNSLERFGQRSPIIYRTELVDGEERKVVYAGNHRLQAALDLGWSEIAAVSADDLTPDEVRAFALADNRTNELGRYDDKALADLLTSLPLGDDELLEATGYNDAAISRLLERSETPEFPDVDLIEPEKDNAVYDAPDSDGVGVTCPHCNQPFDLPMKDVTQ